MQRHGWDLPVPCTSSDRSTATLRLLLVSTPLPSMRLLTVLLLWRDCWRGRGGRWKLRCCDSETPLPWLPPAHCTGEMHATPHCRGLVFIPLYPLQIRRCGGLSSVYVVVHGESCNHASRIWVVVLYVTCLPYFRRRDRLTVAAASCWVAPWEAWAAGQRQHWSCCVVCTSTALAGGATWQQARPLLSLASWSKPWSKQRYVLCRHPTWSILHICAVCLHFLSL